MVILVRGQLEDLLLTENLGVLLGLEGCLAGQAPQGEQADQRHLRADQPSSTRRARCSGPRPSSTRPRSTSSSSSAASRRRRSSRRASPRPQAAEEARKDGLSEAQQADAARVAGEQVLAQFQQQILNLAVRTGQTGPPRLDDPKFVSSIVFDTRFAGGVPKAKFSDFFPNPEAALIAVRLRPDLSEAERDEAIDLYREAVATKEFRLKAGSGERRATSSAACRSSSRG